MLVGLVNTGYYKNILSGILDLTREKDCGLRCFATSLINTSRHWRSGGNTLFSLVDKANVDGLIIISTALENYVGREALDEFFASFRPLPFASIGREAPGAPSIIIDNETGLRELLAHLTDRHSHRRLAFIGGPSSNSEAVGRLDIYRKFLGERGLPYDPDLVAEGDFTGRSGKQAVRTLFGERRAKADVVIAANDLMAFGAIEELNALGFNVPGDVCVVGFDDIDMSREVRLTTVRQPLYEQGYQAAAALYRRLTGEKAAPVTVMATAAVIRSSCGCPSGELAAAALGEEETPESPARPAVRPGTPSAARVAERLTPLRDALEIALHRREAAAFLDEWRRFIQRETAGERDPALLENIVSALRQSAVRRPDAGGFAEDLFHQARILIAEGLRREHAGQRVAAELQEEHFSRIDSSLGGAGTLDDQLQVLYTELPALGIRSCYLSLFTDTLAPLAGARLILAFEDNRKIALPERGLAFPSRELIPPGLQPAGRRNFVVKTLEHRKKCLGFILMELSDSLQSAGILESLSPKLSSVLQLAIFIEDAVNRARELDRVNKRLEESNRALEEFASRASHDLQEPLRKILTFGERLAGAGGDALGAQARDYLERMTGSALRMRKLIERLLAYSHVGTADRPFTPVDLNPLLGRVIASFKETIEATGARIAVDDLPVVSADPAQMYELFRNLVDNALKFQPPGGRPLVTIRSPAPDAGWETIVVVEDNGIGIDPKYHEKIFRVFQRLHGRAEYEGDGIGLAMCRKIMERHGGAIDVESRAGAGAGFIVRFPVGAALP